MCLLLLPTWRLFSGSVQNSSRKKSTSGVLELLKSMPKVPKHVQDAQKQRRKIKDKSSKYVPGRVTLQILGSGAEGAPRSLYVFSDQSRYLFQCGEGTQRLAHEHKMKLAKLEHIFITQSVWKNMGGLPGTALTIQDVGVPRITLHGPKGLDDLFKATKRFVVIKDLEIKMAECREDEPYEDNVMSVTYVQLVKNELTSDVTDESFDSDGDNLKSDKPSKINIEDVSLDKMTQVETVEMIDGSTSTRNPRKSRRRSKSVDQKENFILEEDNTDYYAHERKKSKKRNRSRRRRQNRCSSESGKRTTPETIGEYTRLFLSETKEQAISMAYICRLTPRPGALSLEKCIEFGVPPGPLLGQLKSGQDVTLPSGKIVRSSDVCEPDDPGPVFIVVDCPSEAYLDSLTTNQNFKTHQSQARKDTDFAHLVIHFSPEKVIKNPKYQKWIDDFSPSTQHLMLNESNTCLGSLAVHRIQYKLNLLSREIFPLLGDKGTKSEPSELPALKKFKSDDNVNNLQSNRKEIKEKLNNHLVQANTFCNFHLRPRHGLDNTNELKINPQEYLEETMALEGFTDELNILKTKLLEKRSKMHISPYPKVLFLGTGSCIPNKTRNTSGILIQMDEDLNFILDCGEGTYGQIVRFFGLEKAEVILANIRGIYVSHLHADHHIGLVGVLQGRSRALEKLKLPHRKTLLLAPKQIMNWLHFYDSCFEDINGEYELISNQDLMLPGEVNDFKRRIKKVLDLNDLQTVYVRHCPNAFGVAFTNKNGCKITYSGDTMPSENLIEIGRDSDLLIHEATMEDELAHEAIVKMHSTTSQAIEVGRKMKARHILLTHFSQRYAKLPRFNDNFGDNVGIAFDNMHICVDELPLVPLLYPALKIMFAEHYEELENKAIKRQLRMERQREASEDRKREIS